MITAFSRQCQKHHSLPFDFAVMVTLSASAKLLTLADILTNQTITDVKQVMILTKAITTLLKNVHIDELMMADLDASSISIRNWGQVCAYFPALGANIIQIDPESRTVHDSDLQAQTYDDYIIMVRKLFKLP